MSVARQYNDAVRTADGALPAVCGGGGDAICPGALLIADHERRKLDAESHDRSFSKESGMLKLYKTVDGALHYHEAWIEDDNGIAVEHWGKVGERGTSKPHPLPEDADEDEFLERVLADAVQAGYAPFDDEHVKIMLIEYAIVGMGSKADHKKRQALEARLDDLLGWTGLGNCDGGSIGSGTMEVCCFVVDFELASSTIKSDLAGTEFTDFTRIFLEEA